MLKKSCGLHEEAREHYRLHHCGTCKAIGKQYHQSARMFLNFDCVFLAELLSALSSEDTDNWQSSYHSYNCFSKGGEGIDLPLPLRYAASTNVLLAALKTDDNLKDAPGLAWRIAKRWFKSDFKKAEREMDLLGVDRDEIWHWIECQQQRESTHKLPIKGEELLRYYAEPTARITASIFSRGATLLGAPEAPMYDLGFRFGELVYILDALEDGDKDEKKKQFNALQRTWKNVDEVLRQSVADYLFSLSKQIQDTIQLMPIPQAQREEFSQRLSANLAARIANALEDKKPYAENLKRSLWTRLALRVQNARSFAQQFTQEKTAWVAAPQYAISFLAVFLVPQLPEEVKTAPDQGVTAFWAIVIAFFSALFFYRKFKHFYPISKKRLQNKGESGTFPASRKLGILKRPNDFWESCVEGCLLCICNYICPWLCEKHCRWC